MKYRVHITIERDVVVDIDGDFSTYREVQSTGLMTAMDNGVMHIGDRVIGEPWIENVRERND